MSFKAIFEGTTLINYPNKIAGLMFTGGCNFRCPYCQNSPLVFADDDLPYLEEEELLKKLNKRKNFIDGIVISGGEPTIQPGLSAFMKKVKEVGLLVKIDTNGSKPDVIEHLIKEKIVDYIAMDIKTSRKKYIEILQAEKWLSEIEKSIEILTKSDVEYEFRTTLVPKIIDIDDVDDISELIGEFQTLYLQQFIPNYALTDEYKDVKPYTEGEIIKLYKNLKKNKINVKGRGFLLDLIANYEKSIDVPSPNSN